jgi:hypothetical protein
MPKAEERRAGAVEFPPPQAGRLFLGRNTTRNVHFAWTQGRNLLCARRFRALTVVGTLPIGSKLDDDGRTADRLLKANVPPADLCGVCFSKPFREAYAQKYAATTQTKAAGSPPKA